MKLFFQIKLFSFRDWFYGMQIGWKNRHFGICFLLFHLLYLFSNPYRISRKFFQKKGYKNVYQYGETPLKSFQKICSQMDLHEKDSFLDLGCGRGLCLFWLTSVLKTTALGIDFQPTFIRRARLLNRWTRLSNLVFLQLDFSEIDFSRFTAVYFYGITTETAFMNQLTQKFEEMSEGSKILTISSPINSKHFYTAKTFPVTFNWGKATAYLNIKKKSEMCRMKEKE